MTSLAKITRMHSYALRNSAIIIANLNTLGDATERLLNFSYERKVFVTVQINILATNASLIRTLVGFSIGEKMCCKMRKKLTFDSEFHTKVNRKKLYPSSSGLLLTTLSCNSK